MAQGELGLSLYNPAQLARTELIESFLVRSRQNQLDQLAGLLDPSRSSNGPRHALLLGPRGSGKTTLLLRLAYLIEDDQALQRLWTPVLLVEEQHHIGDLTDLLLSVVRALPESEKALKARADAETVLDKSTTDTVAADFVLEILNRYSSSMGRRLLILIDNFDQILSSMESESQNDLTSILKKEQRIQFVAAAPKRDHHEILGKKLTPLFLSIHLSEVSREEFSALLTNLALLHNNQRVLHTIEASAERLEQLFRDDQRLDRKDIADVGDIFLHLVELHRVHGHVGVVLPVHDLLLQRGKGFRPGHRRRIDAPGLVGLDHDLVLRHPHDEALKIGHRGHRLFGVGQNTEP